MNVYMYVLGYKNEIDLNWFDLIYKREIGYVGNVYILGNVCTSKKKINK